MRDVRGKELSVNDAIVWAEIDEEGAPVLKSGVVQSWDDETGVIRTVNSDAETHIDRTCTVERIDER